MWPKRSRAVVSVKTLITYAETAIRDAGHPCVKLETDTFNERSRAVYRALGYAERDYYPDDEWNSGFTTVSIREDFWRGSRLIRSDATAAN
jgi:RimJ/RimL family protein N-acetyltransferase